MVVLFLAIAFGVIATILSIFVAALLPGGAEIDASYFYLTLANPVVLFLTLIVAAAVGSGLIADDIRHMSLTLYLSRPITTVDYLLAKASIVAFALILAVAFPAVLGPIVAGVLVYVTWEVAIQALLAGIAFGALATVLFSFLVLLFSSLTSRKGIAAAGTFATALTLEFLSQPLSGIFETEEVFYMSLYQNLLAVGRVLYGVEEISDFGIGATGLAWGISLFILVAVMAASSVIAYLRIRSMEVVAPS